MNWLWALFGRDDEPDERARRGAEVRELHAESTIALARANKALRAKDERDRVASAVRNTVRAVRREPMT